MYMDNLTLLKKQLNTLCETVLECSYYKSKLRINLNIIDESQGPSINKFVSDYFGETVFVWSDYEFYNNMFKGAAEKDD